MKISQKNCLQVDVLSCLKLYQESIDSGSVGVIPNSFMFFFGEKILRAQTIVQNISNLKTRGPNFFKMSVNWKVKPSSSLTPYYSKAYRICSTSQCVQWKRESSRPPAGTIHAPAWENLKKVIQKVVQNDVFWWIFRKCSGSPKGVPKGRFEDFWRFFDALKLCEASWDVM